MAKERTGDQVMGEMSPGVEGKKRQQRKITEAESSQKILNLNAFKLLPQNLP